MWGTTRGVHRWPVSLRHGEVELVPVHRRYGREWQKIRARNWEWLSPWEATMPPGAEVGPRSFGQFVAMMNRLGRQGSALPWMVRYGPERNTRLVGQLTVSGITGGSAGWAQVGYWIDRAYAGRGIIPLAVAMACDYCWQVMGLHRIEITIRPENTASLRVVEKLGFRHEGFRPRYLHIDGDWRDHEVFALNVEEVPGGLVARLEGGPEQNVDPD
ncbi:GNAT family N-acetyltransferase [Enemella sp. A6]|uniref:GNAT family N-acetyltransferase n=1 Tax=Enemella sp. A6 TaxID=3440152 RepID=UPI003EBB5A67